MDAQGSAVSKLIEPSTNAPSHKSDTPPSDHVSTVSFMDVDSNINTSSNQCVDPLAELSIAVSTPNTDLHMHPNTNTSVLTHVCKMLQMDREAICIQDAQMLSDLSLMQLPYYSFILTRDYIASPIIKLKFIQHTFDDILKLQKSDPQSFVHEAFVAAAHDGSYPDFNTASDEYEMKECKDFDWVEVTYKSSSLTQHDSHEVFCAKSMSDHPLNYQEHVFNFVSIYRELIRANTFNATESESLRIIGSKGMVTDLLFEILEGGDLMVPILCHFSTLWKQVVIHLLSRTPTKQIKQYISSCIETCKSKDPHFVFKNKSVKALCTRWLGIFYHINGRKIEWPTAEQCELVLPLVNLKILPILFFPMLLKKPKKSSVDAIDVYTKHVLSVTGKSNEEEKDGVSEAQEQNTVQMEDDGENELLILD
eukprot:237808_1